MAFCLAFETLANGQNDSDFSGLDERPGSRR